MHTEAPSERALRTPRAAAIAGLLFSVLVLAIFVLLRLSIPADPLEAGVWLTEHVGRVRGALYLVPFAGIAFLWFIGVLRSRLGDQEDRFFATVFLGSGLLFLALLFMLAAIAEGLMAAFAESATPATDSQAFQFARAAAYSIVNVYMIKMAAVFMFTASTLIICTDIAPRWIALLGYGLALVLLVGSSLVSWSFVVFPLWVMLVSASILRDDFGRMPRSVRARSLRAPRRRAGARMRG
jgi:hypothetical protein